MFRRSISSLTISLAFFAAHVNAVNLADSGIGQALIFPYYTVRNNAISTISVQNQTGRAKALKVRFLEGKASKEVLDFNLYLSANDAWAVALVSTATGAKILVSDRSCTTPPIPSTGQEFRNYAYQGDPLGADLDRSREGYAEIIEMADLIPGSPTANAVTHVNGLPSNCQSITSDSAPRDILVGSGGLSGQGYILNAADGTSFGYNAVALASFAKNHPIWFEPGSIDPNLSHSNPKISYVFDKTRGMIITEWATGTKSVPVDPVSAVLMQADSHNIFQTDPALTSQSAWVVTMPTKSYYFRGNTVTKMFPKDLTNNGACVETLTTLWDVEEGQSAPSLVGVSPSTAELCWESSIINFNAGNVLGSKNAYSLSTGGKIAGHMRMSFGPTAGLFTNGARTTLIAPNATATTRTDVVYVGLPLVGFQVNRLGTSSRPFPILYPHRGDVDIR